MNQTNVLCRQVQFERLTSYILEDFFSEIGRLKMIKIKDYIVTILGYHLKDSNLCLF